MTTELHGPGSSRTPRGKRKLCSQAMSIMFVRCVSSQNTSGSPELPGYFSDCALGIGGPSCHHRGGRGQARPRRTPIPPTAPGCALVRNLNRKGVETPMLQIVTGMYFRPGVRLNSTVQRAVLCTNRGFLRSDEISCRSAGSFRRPGSRECRRLPSRSPST